MGQCGIKDRESIKRVKGVEVITIREERKGEI